MGSNSTSAFSRLCEMRPDNPSVRLSDSVHTAQHGSLTEEADRVENEIAG